MNIDWWKILTVSKSADPSISRSKKERFYDIEYLGQVASTDFMMEKNDWCIIVCPCLHTLGFVF